MGSEILNTSKDKIFKFIDLFAGIGGFRIALERTGGKCVFSSEWDKPCQEMYLENFGEKPAGDITKVLAKDIPDHDILVAGFPCQAFSIIGNKQGFADARGTLFYEIVRILKAKRPQAVLLENVKQLTSHNGGKTLKVILNELEKIGYFVHHKVLNGLDFGVPQKRERTIIVGFTANFPFEFPVKGAETKALVDILQPECEVDKKHLLSDYFRTKLLRNLKLQGKVIGCRPVEVHENKSGNLGIHPHSTALRANGSYNYITLNAERRFTSRELLRLQGFPENFKIVVSNSQLRKQVGNSIVQRLKR